MSLLPALSKVHAIPTSFTHCLFHPFSTQGQLLRITEFDFIVYNGGRGMREVNRYLIGQVTSANSTSTFCLYVQTAAPWFIWSHLTQGITWLQFLLSLFPEEKRKWVYLDIDTTSQEQCLWPEPLISPRRQGGFPLWTRNRCLWITQVRTIDRNMVPSELPWCFSRG